MVTRVYVFTGFLDSGKSSFIADTVLGTDFCENEKTLLLVSEQGEVEFKQEAFEAMECDLAYVDSPLEMTTEYLESLDDKYQPTQVLVEYNGMYNVDDFLTQKFPANWEVVQVLTTINAQTFNLYIQNMRSLLYQHVLHTDLLIFNRISENTKKSFLRNNIKAINSQCQIIYEMEDGSINTLGDDELPFDINADELDILDHDFGLFCMDTMDHPERYEGKTVTLKGKFIGLDKQLDNCFVMGRMAMVCCEQDTSLVGMVCEHPLGEKLVPNEWIKVKGKIYLDYDPEINEDFCILKVDELNVVPPLENEYVTFD
ncbi:MAG: hypothetical protein LUG46_07390 [Erysipelotrichaceae bacterium]|nr:hypothetical protein [Erysipelotrichaceae bacterium]